MFFIVNVNEFLCIKKVSRLLGFEAKSIYWNNAATNIQIISFIPHLGAAVVEATLTLQQLTTRHT